MIMKLSELLDATITGEWGEDCVGDSGVKVLRTTNFTNIGVINYDKVVERNISKEKVQKKQLKKGDIIVEKSGGTKETPVGRVVYFDADGEYLCNNFTQILRPNTNFVTPKYLFYCLFAYYQFRVTERLYNKTTGIQNLQMNRYLALPIPIVSKAQQDNICKELDHLFDLMAKRKEEIALLDVLVKSQFIEMFGDIVRNERGWRREIVDQIAPAVPYRGQLDSTDGKFWLLNLDMVEAQTGEIISKVMVDEAEIGTSTTTFGRENVLYSKLRPYLNKVVIPAESGYATSEFIPLKPNPKKLNKYYFASALRSDAFVSYIQEQVAGAKMPRVSMGVFRAFLFPCPPIELQEQFAHFVEQTDKSKILGQKQKNLLFLLRNTISTIKTLVNKSKIGYNIMKEDVI